eukprot:Gregarina_sp_Poly_1__8766@NODE_525_length_7703_cov_51_704164_g416_i0_p10_GENE_NODE_525_length_7703_cov_51_704164_g416_i0NODE_525_length_7703_cov_51_704164_g416_i0_p10_ORF_typecomplete_len107_score13_93_NODE_525_length_7703_cov_51_704164_g416_i0346666
MKQSMTAFQVISFQVIVVLGFLLTRRGANPEVGPTEHLMCKYPCILLPSSDAYFIVLNAPDNLWIWLRLSHATLVQHWNRLENIDNNEAIDENDDLKAVIDCFMKQ